MTDTKPIHETIPEIKGQIVLVGESGLGKSMFLKNLVKFLQRSDTFVQLLRYRQVD